MINMGRRPPPMKKKEKTMATFGNGTYKESEKFIRIKEAKPVEK